MTRRALLIGAETGELKGVGNDVAAMAGALGPRGFDIRTLTGSAATRKGILEAYRALIDEARPDDACVVYYSGHGGLAHPPAGEPPLPGDAFGAGRAELQFIVPADYDESTPDDFRGITSRELSGLLVALSRVTDNATVVLDCCHSAHMSRESVGPRRPRGWWRPSAAGTHVTYDMIRRHDEIHAPMRRALHSNPVAVRVVACAPHEAAWEDDNRAGITMGVFTDALTRTLIQTQELRVSWTTVLDAVRAEVQVMSPTQRPEVEGPSARRPFEIEDLHAAATLPVVVTDPGRVRLLGAPLIGVRPGDEFAIMPAAATGPGDGPPIGTARVTALGPTVAAADLTLAPGRTEVPADARAHQTVAAEPRVPVRLPDHPAAADLIARMAVQPLLRPAGPGEATRLAVEAGTAGLVVHDRIGPLHAPRPATPAGLDEVVADLLRIAQCETLRRFAPDSGPPLPGVRLEWGRVRGGEAEPLPASGGLLYSGEGLYVAVHNDGGDDVYCSLVDIGASYRIGPLTAADPGGRLIPGGSAFVFGWNEDAEALEGDELYWPEGIDPALPRPETILAVVSREPIDVGVLHQSGVRGEGPASPLAQWFEQALRGGNRDTVPRQGAPRYTLTPIDFTLSPEPPPARESATFLVDDRPPESVRGLAPRGEPPVRLAVRLGGVSAPGRLDALVVTAGPQGWPVYRAATVRPGGDGVLYEGPAAECLDVAVWATPDEPGRPALAAVLADGLPDVAAVVDAAAGALPASTGLYRNTLLAAERFGAGSYRRRAGGCAFTLDIEPLH